MEKSNYEELLKKRYIASLATLNEDGTIHLVAMWYLYEDGEFYIPTSSMSKKIRNLAAQPQATIMVDVRGKPEVSGISVRGKATIITGERAAHINRKIHQRYMSKDAIADPEVGPAFTANDDVTIKITPEKWTSWGIGSSELSLLGDLSSPGYRLPLD
jgi:PPOX class probable F420-dependent enzyme